MEENGNLGRTFAARVILLSVSIGDTKYPTEDARMIFRWMIHLRLRFPHVELGSRVIVAKILDRPWRCSLICVCEKHFLIVPRCPGCLNFWLPGHPSAQ